MRAIYSLQTGAAVALSAATAKTALGIICPAQFGIDLLGFECAFDGVTASAVPVLLEICTSTLASNSTPGSNNTTGTVNQIAGRSLTAGFTGFYASTSEPTVLTPVWSTLLTPNGGSLVYDFPRDQTFDTAVSAGICFRLTATFAVNARMTATFARA